MNKDKQLEKDCKKLINEVVFIIKKDPSKSIDKVLNKLKEKW